MSRVRGAGTLLWGLLLLAAGALLLAHNLGYAVPIWSGVARYWPAILIVWGLFKLADFYRQRQSGGAGPLFSAGEVALLVLIILAGSAITIAANISPELGDLFHLRVGDIDIWDITGNSYEYAEHHETEARSDSTIEIINRYGAVDVAPSETDRIIVDVKKTVLASNQEEADRLSKTLNFSVNDQGSGYRIVAGFESGQDGGRGRRFKTSLSVRVPKRASLRIDNRNGSVTVAGLIGNQTITKLQNRNGSVEVTNVKGGATIQNSFANVEVRSITGALELHNRNGGVDVANIGEAAKISTSFASTVAKNIGGDLEIDSRNGSVDVDSVKGNATIATSYASINVSNVQGAVRTTGRNNSVEVEHASGDVSVETSYQSVSIRDAKGAITVNSRNGDVLVSLPQAPKQDISVSTAYSSVTLELPAASAFSIDARTRFGQIHSGFAELSVGGSDPQRSVNGRVGQGGPNIKIDTRNGDIHLDRRG